jgi:cell division protein FtsB
MKSRRPVPKYTRERVKQGVAIACLLAMAGWALAGPSGLFAWGENQRLLEQRRVEIAQLTRERNQLQNRVDLLDPRHTDPDLAGELLRKNLNVAHPDEMVMLLH